MQCPACRNELTEKKVDSVTVDVCQNGCGGIWFDQYEIEKFDEPDELPGEQLLEISKNPNIKPDRQKRYNCPKCSDVVMMRHFFSIKHQVEIDECPGCAGIFLDAGELTQIRSLYDSEQQRKAAAEKYFSDNFEQQLKPIAQQDQQNLCKARKFANLFKFICPSYWIPGDQSGAAF
jgi:hypothetical protein